MALESVAFAFLPGLGCGVCSRMVTDGVLSVRCLPQDVADNQIDSGDLMECLIQNKHQKDMNEKCAVGVTHFQLVSSARHALLVPSD